jgi:hypothetical protein
LYVEYVLFFFYKIKHNIILRNKKIMSTIDLSMEEILEKEMEEMEANIANLTIQEDVGSIVYDIVNEIERLEPPSKAEVAANRLIRQRSGDPDLAQIEADMTILSMSNKYESEIAFAECVDRVDRFVEQTKIPTFIQQPPAGFIRSNSVYDVSGESAEFTVLLPGRFVPSPIVPCPPKLARCVSEMPPQLTRSDSEAPPPLARYESQAPPMVRSDEEPQDSAFIPRMSRSVTDAF